MGEQFRDQGGAASSDPSWLRRTLTSLMMRRLGDPARRDHARARFEAKRRSKGEPHRVSVFFQADDAYSALAAQLWLPVLARYDITLKPYLVSSLDDANTPEPTLLGAYARRDCAQVAPHYGLHFPAAAQALSPDLVALAEQILAAQQSVAFIDLAAKVAAALWAGDVAGLDALAAAHGRAAPDATRERISAGNTLRARLGHYAGAMFHYGGEWYWGVDRLHHLERRLRALGASRAPDAPLLAPRPEILPAPAFGKGLTLEFYASLRSPYTAVIYDRAVQLARDSGVALELKPVLPMVMRGVPVTVQKGRYIFFDAAREAEDLGIAPGRPRDPIGEPVRRLYAMLPWAMSCGRGVELLGVGLRAAFREGVDLAGERGLRQVVEAAGLSWVEACEHRHDTAWQALFEQNRQGLYGCGIWGVPAFRLLDAQGRELVSAWGQDRLWLVAREMGASS